MSKKAKRIEARDRAELDALRQKEVRQSKNPEDTKNPIERPVRAAKVARSAPLRLYDMVMDYRDDWKDIIGRWTWGQYRDWGEEVWGDTLKPFLDEYKTKTWKDIESERAEGKQKHVCYPKRNTITKEARDRLKEIGRIELEESIFRFRLAGRQRLFGFRLEGKFYLIWWDRDHKICPSKKRNT